MVHSLYQELIGLTEASEEEVIKLLEELNLASIFMPALEQHRGNGWIKPIVMYTAYTYSWESKMVHLGQDWHKAKLAIARRVNLPEEAYPDVVEVKDQTLGRAFMAFLSLYQDNMDYVHLVNLKEFYQKTMLAARLQTNTDTDMREDKYEELKRCKVMKADIDEMEEVLREKYKLTMKVQSQDPSLPKNSRGNPLQLENSVMIKD